MVVNFNRESINDKKRYKNIKILPHDQKVVYLQP